MKTLFVPGLWFNHGGPIACRFRTQGVEILSLRGIPTLKERVGYLLDTLLHSSFETIIGHSAGCTVLTEAMRCFRSDCKTTRIVLLNPAPAQGIKFTPMDPIFWTMMKPQYLWAMATGKNFMLTDGDTKKLLSLEEHQVDEMMKNLLLDSGAFARELTMRQYKQKVTLNPPPGVKLFVATSKKDRMVGSAGGMKTVKQFGSNVIHTDVSPGGHMSLVNDMLFRLIKQWSEAGVW